MGYQLIKQLREERGWSLAELAQKVGSYPQQVSKIELGHQKLTDDWIKKFSLAFGVNAGVFFEDKGFIKNILQPTIARSIGEVQFGPEIISVYGHIRNQSGVLVLDKTQAVTRVLSHPNQKDAAKKSAAYPPDESMSPRFDLSDIAFYNEGQYPSEMQDCFVEMNNGEFHLKKFVRANDKEVICRQLNPVKDWKRLKSEIKAVHAVVGRG